jgi:micrococcal nuclease
MYDYSATVVSVHDGDTATFDIDLGFRIFSRSALRFYGIDAPELSTEKGKAARAHLKDVLPVGQKVRLVTTRNEFDKYGRYLATVYLEDMNLNEALVDAGFAKAWSGTGQKPT